MDITTLHHGLISSLLRASSRPQRGWSTINSALLSRLSLCVFVRLPIWACLCSYCHCSLGFICKRHKQRQLRKVDGLLEFCIFFFLSRARISKCVHQHTSCSFVVIFNGIFKFYSYNAGTKRREVPSISSIQICIFTWQWCTHSRGGNNGSISLQFRLVEVQHLAHLSLPTTQFSSCRPLSLF